MVDVAADGGWLFTALNTMNLLQMVIQVFDIDNITDNDRVNGKIARLY